MLKKMDISVVIGSYNQCDRLKRVIEGYCQQIAQISFEVIIIDSFSTDDTAQMIAEFKHCPFTLNFIQRENPSGKAEARNTGVAAAKVKSLLYRMLTWFLVLILFKVTLMLTDRARMFVAMKAWLII